MPHCLRKQGGEAWVRQALHSAAQQAPLRSNEAQACLEACRVLPHARAQLPGARKVQELCMQPIFVLNCGGE